MLRRKVDGRYSVLRINDPIVKKNMIDLVSTYWMTGFNVASKISSCDENAEKA